MKQYPKDHPRYTPIQDSGNGHKSWKEEPGDKYRVSYTLPGQKKSHYKDFSSYIHARSINIHTGSVWLLRDGRKYLIDRVTN